MEKLQPTSHLLVSFEKFKMRFRKCKVMSTRAGILLIYSQLPANATFSSNVHKKYAWPTRQKEEKFSSQISRRTRANSKAKLKVSFRSFKWSRKNKTKKRRKTNRRRTRKLNQRDWNLGRFGGGWCDKVFNNGWDNRRRLADDRCDVEEWSDERNKAKAVELIGFRQASSKVHSKRLSFKSFKRKASD